MIAIVDYGLGNLASIKNMFKRVGERDVVISSDVSVIKNADKVILPGVGAFDAGMSNLKKYGLIDVLNKKALDEKVPFLGICLGLQLMCAFSEEGQTKCLGIFNTEVRSFPKTDLVSHEVFCQSKSQYFKYKCIIDEIKFASGKTPGSFFTD